ncbi:MAG: thioesterase family protein [Burkholderiales bacterium]|nr:thioesterase family protein [Burkholderiales bacterium]
MAPLQTHGLRITLTEDDRPEDRFSHHVNNARYFAFINRTFHGWYVALGIRVRDATHSAMMVNTSYDFLRQVFVPGAVLCRITVTKVGRTSMEHTVEMWDVSTDTPVLAGRGRVAHVWVERAIAKPQPWPPELLAKCWDPDAAPAA